MKNLFLATICAVVFSACQSTSTPPLESVSGASVSSRFVTVEKLERNLLLVRDTRHGCFYYRSTGYSSGLFMTPVLDASGDPICGQSNFNDVVEEEPSYGSLEWYRKRNER